MLPKKYKKLFNTVKLFHKDTHIYIFIFTIKNFCSDHFSFMHAHLPTHLHTTPDTAIDSLIFGPAAVVIAEVHEK